MTRQKIRESGWPVLSEIAAPASGDGATARTDRSMFEHLRTSKIYRDYQRAFEATTGLPLSLRKPGSFQSPLHDSKLINSFCAGMAGQNQTCAACLRLQHRIELEGSIRPSTLDCFAGLTESMVPVRMGERVIAYLQTGQVFLRRPSVARFEHLHRQMAGWGLEVDAMALKDAYFKTRVIGRRQYESILRLLVIFAQHLSCLIRQFLVRPAGAELPSVARARIFISEHQGEMIGLSQVARAVNMSVYYFCRIFKQSTGISFTDYLARVRVESVKQILLDPHKRVSEAAFEAGFQSLSQFNRVFRRVAGEAPGDYRRAPSFFS